MRAVDSECALSPPCKLQNLQLAGDLSSPVQQHFFVLIALVAFFIWSCASWARPLPPSFMSVALSLKGAHMSHLPEYGFFTFSMHAPSLTVSMQAPMCRVPRQERL
eukprot:CAMPEP_0197896530 /NCGR_PEP_ID=MMETSP1439-20131203/40122_1 /TAXON_ID=66791 /ORGANISM="Gonyaulax spinifera, Strain CCMP409" /LENGTH=105 /DNA_ID=CAMNT_0043517069 /DNA_START=188 /DNA_END=507 /DNA_ORIENTATION=+